MLSQLSFLLLADDETSGALISHALRLRPYQTEVLYLAGLRQAENGDLDAAMKYWLRPFKTDRGFRESIIASLAPYLAPEDLIERLGLDAAGAYALFRYYSRVGDDDAQRKTTSWFRDEFPRLVFDRAATDCQFWHQSHVLLEFAGDAEKSLFCLASICREHPSNFAFRKRYGLALLNAQATSAARRELEWCRLRNPDDREIAEALTTLSESPNEELAIDAR